MTAAKNKYSLWLTPRGEAAASLQAIVNQISGENNLPQFSIHMTVVADIFADAAELDDVKSKVAEIARRIRPFTLHFSKYGYLDEEFRSLYLLAISPALDNVYQVASAVFPQVYAEHFRAMPHLSVLYGMLPMESKRQIIAEHPAQDMPCEISTLDLYFTNNPVSSWRLEASFPLGQPGQI